MDGIPVVKDPLSPPAFLEIGDRNFGIREGRWWIMVNQDGAQKPNLRSTR